MCSEKRRSRVKIRCLQSAEDGDAPLSATLRLFRSHLVFSMYCTQYPGDSRRNENNMIRTHGQNRLDSSRSTRPTSKKTVAVFLLVDVFARCLFARCQSKTRLDSNRNVPCKTKLEEENNLSIFAELKERSVECFFGTSENFQSHDSKADAQNLQHKSDALQTSTCIKYVERSIMREFQTCATLTSVDFCHAPSRV